MSQKVINVKVEHIRPKYQNLKEWIEADPSKHIYIGRPGVVFVDGVRYPPVTHATCKLFQNPFKIDKEKKSSRTHVLAQFRKYALGRLETDESFKDAVKALTAAAAKEGASADLLLGCWCKPEGCHGDILLELSRELNSRKSSDAGQQTTSNNETKNRRRDRKETLNDNEFE